MQVAREFTHERTKQCIAHLKAIASSPPWKPRMDTPESSPRGRGFSRRADQLFVHEQLKELLINEPAFVHCPALLGACPETPDQEQYDSTQEDPKQDEGDATSLLDAELDASWGEETDALGHLHRSLSADRHRQRNRALWREHNRAR